MAPNAQSLCQPPSGRRGALPRRPAYRLAVVSAMAIAISAGCSTGPSGPGETPPAKTATSSQLPSPTGSPNRLDTATPSPTLATASNAGSPTASKPHPASLTGTPQGLVHGLVVLVSKCGNQPSPGTCSQQRSPTASTIQALDSSSHVVAQTRSETNGEYSIRLAGGHYTLHAIVNPTIECDTDVEVPAGGTLTTQIDCDENIP